jgi:hypothetical protein
MGKKRQPRYMDHFLYRIDMKSFLIHVSRHCQTQAEAFQRMLGISPDHLKLGSRVHITRLCAGEKFGGLHENG